MLMDEGRALTSEDASDDREHGFEQGQPAAAAAAGLRFTLHNQHPV